MLSWPETYIQNPDNLRFLLHLLGQNIAIKIVISAKNYFILHNVNISGNKKIRLRKRLSFLQYKSLFAIMGVAIATNSYIFYIFSIYTFGKNQQILMKTFWSPCMIKNDSS